MNQRLTLMLGAVLLGIVLVANSMFVVRETEYAIKFQFSAIMRSDYGPGLHFKLPLVDSVLKFDRRVLARGFPAEQFLTSEGKILNVDFYTKWRITDVDQYYRSTSGSEETAAGRLAEIVKDGLKGLIAKLPLLVYERNGQLACDFAQNSVRLRVAEANQVIMRPLVAR